MKHVFTVSLDEELVQQIRVAYREKKFRNKSQMVGEAIKQFLDNHEVER